MMRKSLAEIFTEVPKIVHVSMHAWGEVTLCMVIETAYITVSIGYW